LSQVTFKHTFKTENGEPLSNADLSVYLHNTTTAVRIFDTDGNLYDEAPQISTDEDGEVEFLVDNGDYSSGTVLEINCEPGPCHPTEDAQTLLWDTSSANYDDLRDASAGLVYNGSFELGDIGWSLTYGGWYIDRAEYHTGSKCARHDGEDGEAWFTSEAITGIVPESRYFIEVWAKSSGSPDGRLQVMMQFRESDNTWIENHNPIDTNSDTVDSSWDVFRVIAHAPANAASMTVRLKVTGSTQGSYYVDDIRVYPMPRIKDSLPYLTVGTSGEDVMFTSISDAVAALDSDWAGIFIKKGTHTISSTISLPDYDMDMVGESKKATVIQTPDNDNAFERLSSTSKRFSFRKLKFDSQTDSGGAKIIKFDNSGAFTLDVEHCTFDLWDTGDPTAGNTGGDTAVEVDNDSGNNATVNFLNNVVSGGYKGFFVEDALKVRAQSNNLDGQLYQSIDCTDVDSVIIQQNIITDFQYIGIGVGSGNNNLINIGHNFVNSKDDSADQTLYGILANGARNMTICSNTVEIDDSRNSAAQATYVSNTVCINSKMISCCIVCIYFYFVICNYGII